VERISAHQAEERRVVLLDRISSHNYEDFHAGVANSRAKDTGGWLLESNEFRNWEEKPGVLPCKGSPGSGKTVLSSLVVNHLRQYRIEGVAIVKIYYNCSDPQTANSIIRSVLRQLVCTLFECFLPLD